MNKLMTVLGALGLGTAAMAQINATGSISYTLSCLDYTYDISLHNTGTTTIGTLWYAWIPGEDYLPIKPASQTGPAGWQILVSNAAGTGFGIRLVAPAGSLLNPGETLSGFKFTTTTTPTELLGNALFTTHPPVGTSFVYEGGPFTGQSKQFVINPVPEPTTMLVLASGAGLFLRRRRRA